MFPVHDAQRWAHGPDLCEGGASERGRQADLVKEKKKRKKRIKKKQNENQ
jgi:hypothetical protein